MYILGIETTGPAGSVALLDGAGRICGCVSSREQMSHLKNLMPMVAKLLTDCGVDKKDLAYVAPSVGPGSFTGIRIGVSTARALGQALGLPLGVAVPTLDAFLYKEEAMAHIASGGVVCGIINARRGQVYGIVAGEETYLPGGPYMLDEVLDVIQREVLPAGKTVLFVGDGIDAYSDRIAEALGAEALEETYFFAPEDVRYQDAVAVCSWAARVVADGTDAVKPYEQILPDYMRRAEAEEKLAAGQLPICKGPKQE